MKYFKKIFARVKLFVDSIFYSKIVGATKHGGLYVIRNSKGYYYLAIADDRFDSSFTVSNETKDFEELVKLASIIPWEYPAKEPTNSMLEAYDLKELYI